MKNVTYFLQTIDAVAQQLLTEIKDHKIIGLIGPLGAGKTTLIAAMLRALGVQEPALSPTFTYVNMHQAPDGRTIYHFDLYRLKNIQEFEQLGFFEYLDQPNSLVFIEWPEILESMLGRKMYYLKLSSIDEKQRSIAYEL
jgi:tRNA threonylcarbamoyladenosine biosynthesis protein TsaE